jgi:hypothetical protein
LFDASERPAARRSAPAVIAFIPAVQPVRAAVVATRGQKARQNKNEDKSGKKINTRVFVDEVNHRSHVRGYGRDVCVR